MSVKNVVVTGASQGIGRAVCKKFLDCGFNVFGIDIQPSKGMLDYPSYTHHMADVSDKNNLPEIQSVSFLVNCAGVGEEGSSIAVNLLGSINACVKYALSSEIIESVVNVVSVSAHNGAEYPLYSASKGGLLAYTKWLAQELAPKSVTVNSVSPGGVITPMTDHIWEDENKRRLVLNETLLNKWAQPEEISEWIYFLCVVNRSATGQDIIIDNGETSKFNFIK